ncbi:MAG: hypothetical protein LBE27_03225 [Deltaproteobacteria bacterium]|jgi:hypothetical protein|nr:hypothetical protein [Deltaproteobacteria bacterium]
MAKDLLISNKTQGNNSNPICKVAEHCCWYETNRESSTVCAHRNELICQLRREEVFGEKQQLAADMAAEDALAQF